MFAQITIEGRIIICWHFLNKESCLVEIFMKRFLSRFTFNELTINSHETTEYLPY